MKVKVFGAGSIGNHLAHGCRSKGWDVLICDTDSDALRRTKEEIYPSRYGEWDEGIRLSTVDEVEEEVFDLVIIGTPPNSHLPIAIKELESNSPPKVILIEKPACSPSLEGMQKAMDLAKSKSVLLTVGYNHVLTDNTKKLEQLFNEGAVGKVETLTAAFREYWGGIFAAHPWLDGPHDSYLGFFEQGGGACGEHSHAINIWLHLSHLCGLGRIVEVTATMNIVEENGCDYDSIAVLGVKTESGYVGSIIQDVVTEPSLKMARIQGDSGFIEWQVNRSSDADGLIYTNTDGEVIEELFEKTRPKDFQGEIDHVGELLDDVSLINSSPIAAERGFDTMMVVAAAYLSNKEKRTVSIDYSKGYKLSALALV